MTEKIDYTESKNSRITITPDGDLRIKIGKFDTEKAEEIIAFCREVLLQKGNPFRTYRSSVKWVNDKWVVNSSTREYDRDRYILNTNGISSIVRNILLFHFEKNSLPLALKEKRKFDQLVHNITSHINTHLIKDAGKKFQQDLLVKELNDQIGKLTATRKALLEKLRNNGLI